LVSEKRVEVLDECKLDLHTRTSLGLKLENVHLMSEVERKMGLEATRGKSYEEYRAVEFGYETWEQIYGRLDI
jgi:hypothetical protein